MKTKAISHVDYLVAAKTCLLGRLHSFARTGGFGPCVTGLCEATFDYLLLLSAATFWRTLPTEDVSQQERLPRTFIMQ